MANLNLNKVILGGRLTADPELRTTPNGVPTTSFSIAINKPGKDAGTDFIDCVAWRQNAEFICKYFKKGSNICITGSIHNHNWTDKENQKHYKDEVTVEDVTFVDSKSEMATTDAVEAEPVPVVAEEKPKRTRKAKTAEPVEETKSDDLPF
jgi:single-strand DNA-binding protein